MKGKISSVCSILAEILTPQSAEIDLAILRLLRNIRTTSFSTSCSKYLWRFYSPSHPTALRSVNRSHIRTITKRRTITNPPWTKWHAAQPDGLQRKANGKGTSREAKNCKGRKG